MPLIESEIKQRDGLLASPPLSSPPPLQFPYQKEPTPSSSSSQGNKISPAVLFVIVIIAVIFFISGLVHLLIRFLLKQRSSSPISQSNRYSAMSASDAFQRQLQQLFQLHDSGLDQAFIDALPVFLYKEIMGLREPFDCAVCLCEFSEHDKLRLLPSCGHAFHIDCIDTWLLSNSTCPLCRGSLFTPGFSMENPVFEFEGSREEDRFPGHGPCGIGVSSDYKQSEDEIVADKRVFFVKLGKFRSTNDNSVGGGEVKEGETSSSTSNLDARRCYSMGSFQYVVADSSLQVALHPHGGAARGNGDISRRRVGQIGNSAVDGDIEGKKINMRSKGESFSVSKIWQWSKKGKYPSSSGTHMITSPANVGLPWIDRTQAV